MIGKIIKGTSFRGALNYLFFGNKNSRNKNSVVVASNMAGTNPRELSKEFSAFRKLRPSLGKAVCHISLSLSPEDRKLSNDEFGQVAQDFLKQMGFDECPFVAIRHHDTEHPHIHIIVSRIKPNSSVVSDKQDFQRAEKIIRQMESRLGLRSVLPSRQTLKRKRRKSNIGDQNMDISKIQADLTHKLDQAKAHTTLIDDFFKLCARMGITLEPLMEGLNISGIIYKYLGLRFPSSSLGESYTWKALAKHFSLPGIATLHLMGLFKSQPKVIDNQVACKDSTFRFSRDERRNTLNEQYIEEMAGVFSEGDYEIAIGTNCVYYQFSNNQIITDACHTIYASGVSSDQVGADYLIRLCIAKKWGEVQFKGSDNFVLQAMQQALASGLVVVPLGQKQEAMLQQLKKSRGTAQADVAGPVSTSTPATTDEANDLTLPSPKAMSNRLQGFRAKQNAEFEQNKPGAKKSHSFKSA